MESRWNALASGKMTELVSRLEERRSVMALVGHLFPRKRQEIERAVRLLRAHFIDRSPRAPRRGKLHKIMLVGRYARAEVVADRETGEINTYDIWAFVDHPAYRGLNRSWGLVRNVIAMSLQGRATINLSVFALDEFDRLRIAGNRFLTDQYDAGVTLYERDERRSHDYTHDDV
jgi:hypothetical protein